MKRLGKVLVAVAATGAFALAWLSAFVDWPKLFTDPSVGAMMAWATLIGMGVLGAFLVSSS